MPHPEYQKRDLHCPHCQGRLQPMEMPEQSNYDHRVHWVCFNDDCSYYREGWEWMKEQYNAKASYRFRITDPDKGTESPLAVWSPRAHLDRILDRQ